jgi:hypothetical protein
MLHNVQTVNGTWSGIRLSDISGGFSRYLFDRRTRRATSVVVFIACVILILTFSDQIIFLNTETDVSIRFSLRVFSLATFIWLAIINFAIPYVTASVKSFKCLKCGSMMETSELTCQNCGSNFRFKII